jgi:hypothetical protein
MQNRGGWDSKDYPQGMQYYRLAVIGAGAAAPVAPSNGLVPPLWPIKASVLSSLATEIPTRTGAGVYTATVAAPWRMVAWLDVSIDISGTPGAWGQVSAWNPTTGVITFRTFNAGGTATDITSSDLVVMTISGVDSSTIK